MVHPGPAAPAGASSLAQVIAEVVAPAAAEVDRSPMFPRAGVGALAEAGLLALPTRSVSGEARGDMAVGARVVSELARHCASTAAVVLAHYAASAVFHAHAAPAVRDDVTSGDVVATLAVFGPGPPWSPAGTAIHYLGGMRIDGATLGVISAGQADVYIWATAPVRAEGASTLWLLPDGTPGLRVTGAYDAVGLRGAAIAPMTSQTVAVPVETMLGPNGSGRDVLVATALPWLLVGAGALVVGIIDALLDGTVAHLTGGRGREPEGASEPTPATAPGEAVIEAVGHMAARVGAARAAVEAAAAAWGPGRPDALRRAAEARLAADQAARDVADLTVDACGEAAVRTDLSLERHLRDARTAAALAPPATALAALAGRVASGFPPFP